MTPFPRMNDFMMAGIDLAQAKEVERRWLILSEEERQQVVRRIVPLRDTALDDLLA